VGAVLSLVYLAIVTRTLGPEGFGHFALILSTAQVTGTIVSFESWQIIVKYGQAHVRNADNERFGRLLTFCVVIDVIAAMTGCLLAAAIAFLAGPYFGWTEEVTWQAIGFCAVLLFTLRSTPMGILRLFDRFDVGAMAETVVPIIRMVGAVIAWLTTPTITAFLIAWAAAEVLSGLAYWIMAVRTAKKRMGKWNKRRFLNARHENEGLLGFLTATNLSISVAALTRQFSVLIVGFFAGATDAGLYRLAYQLSNALTKISMLLSRTIFAELAKVHAWETGKELKKLFRRTNRLSFIMGGVVILLIVTLGKPILLLMAGPEFAGAYPLLVLLGIAASIELIGVSYEPLLMATGHARTSMTIKLLNALFLFALLTVLLPRFGPAGAASANVAVALAGIIAMGIAARRYTRQARQAAG
jgi:O-antigen/teichoic acid export membrane protein